MCRTPINKKLLVALPDMPMDQETEENGRDFRAQKAKELIRLIKLCGTEKCLVFSQYAFFQIVVT